MPQNEDMRPEEGDEISAIIAESIESNSKKDDISPEDAAWADSCFISDPEVSDDSWDALREAILESPTAQAAHDDDEPSEEARAMELAEPGVEAICGGHVQAEVMEGRVAKADGGEEGKDNVESLLGSQEEIEPLVWAMETTEEEEEEEEELIKNLKKALAETKFKHPQQQPADVDELVVGLGDLSLEPVAGLGDLSLELPSDQSEGSI